ncbi:FRG domain-containing protein [Halomonas salinarum]|uniref:FRG domain-containing protein n=1 Tax=Halomonas salinarum TaxID=1158993 RepID=UPI001ADE2D2D|nr:FRG domain-containing protein [Halomonas salinarum]
MPDEFNWGKVPTWQSDSPEKSFEILSDEFSGRIPATKIEGWKDFVELLESPFFDALGTEWVFRGHRRFDWSMTPTLGRLTDDGIVTEELASQQLGLFRKAIRGRTTDHSLLEDGVDDDELWSIGQHHGLMTPLLDWTYSPYVALFFAFSKENRKDEKENSYRAVYALNKTFVSNDEFCPDIRVFEPRKDDHGRLVSQAGLFTFSPFDSTIENKLAEVLWSEEFPIDALKDADESEEASILARYICKIYIKNEGQKECLRHLRRMNVHHASLFPDLIGAADYCNTYMEDHNSSTSQDSLKISGHDQSPGADDHLESKEVLESNVSDAFVESGKVDLKDSGFDEEIAKTFMDGVFGDKSKPEKSTPRPRKFKSVESLLLTPDSARSISVESIDKLSKELSKVVASGKLVDWMERESLQAEIKAKTRALLRRHSYPEEAREYIVSHILDVSSEPDND